MNNWSLQRKEFVGVASDFNMFPMFIYDVEKNTLLGYKAWVELWLYQWGERGGFKPSKNMGSLVISCDLSISHEELEKYLKYFIYIYQKI